MKGHGLVYNYSWDRNFGVTTITVETSFLDSLIINGVRRAKNGMPKFTGNISRSLVRGVGTGMIAISLVGVALTLQPIVVPELSYRVSALAKTVTNEQTPTPQPLVAAQTSEEDEITKAKEFAQNVGVENTDFSIYIPKINAKENVIANVDATNRPVYKNALKHGVAHAQGTALPGQKGGTYIFAHSTDGVWNVESYNAVFYLLKELKPENKDKIYVFHKDKLHTYVVTGKYTVDADDTSWLTGAHIGGERLILQTCWPPGATWRRLVIVAYPEKSIYGTTSGPYGGT